MSEGCPVSARVLVPALEVAEKAREGPAVGEEGRGVMCAAGLGRMGSCAISGLCGGLGVCAREESKSPMFEGKAEPTDGVLNVLFKCWYRSTCRLASSTAFSLSSSLRRSGTSGNICASRTRWDGDRLGATSDSSFDCAVDGVRKSSEPEALCLMGCLVEGQRYAPKAWLIPEGRAVVGLLSGPVVERAWPDVTNGCGGGWDSPPAGERAGGWGRREEEEEEGGGGMVSWRVGGVKPELEDRVGVI